MRDISREIPSFYDFSSRHIIFRHVKQDGCYSVTSQTAWPQGMLTRAFQKLPCACACYGSEHGCRQRKSQSGGFYLFFFFLRENWRSASRGFFVAWLLPTFNSGKKQTRSTTRLTSHANDGFVAMRKRNLLTRKVEVFVYLWSVKSWALTTCMENPEIPWRSQMERFIPVEILR